MNDTLLQSSQTAMQALRTSLAKASLCLAGLALLYSISHSAWAVITLGATSICAFLAGSWLRAAPRSFIHKLAARFPVPLAFVGLVTLNVTGLVGTLTGAQSSLSQGASSALIAMPFYLLSAAAFITDMAAQRTAQPRFLDFLVYMMMPFKLLAGPLEPPRLLEQIRSFSFRLRRSRLLVAWPWIVLGAFMKYVVANRLDPARHLIHTDPVASFVTAAVFELKFYFDFAGYSFIGYGAAIALGLHVNQNFNHPFLAPNVVLFWRNWHMSLGRFLSKYVLEPNLSLWQGRTQKLVFASSIFLVSAMWHGGTLNYLIWGLFHGACYFVYGQWLKRKAIPAAVGVLAMLLFFVFGRMFAVDADSARLLSRIGNFFDPQAYVWSLGTPSAMQSFLSAAEVRGLAMAAAFLAFELLSSKLYKSRRGYHLMRRPMFTFMLAILFILFGLNTGTLLYARI